MLLAAVGVAVLFVGWYGKFFEVYDYRGQPWAGDRPPAELVGAYESGLGTRLPRHERAAIPLGIARQPLWSIAVWVALLDDRDTARRHLAATAPELTWARQLTSRITLLQIALSGAA